MNKFILASAALAATCLTAMAQDAKQAPEGAESLPKACQAASPGQGVTGKAMEMGDMAAHSMFDMRGPQTASMKAMHEMNRAMRAAHGIKDPDLAFVCGMIAHHRGAVAMSTIELQHGKDEQAKSWAKAIIADQEKQIAQFESWANARAK
ncbi:DUF305 domain-containing protein [Methylopila sp. Yamaguchi]|uniref:DUF305 domain-containing protein n=1 Tax=Methylopila sp. Yamaguchi TaxID=1437817 RepID=UPI000CC9DD6D|nr:DUF305 domain-containing protein [Methylopila sp. Yamaguchi]GBD49715.1 hypothetical protein METY_2928 [Methylopila sp. Yamaguchi]